MFTHSSWRWIPVFICTQLALVAGAHAAPKKPVAPSAPAVSSGVLEFSHELAGPNAARLQALVDRFNQQNGTQLKLVFADGTVRPTLLNLATPLNISDFLQRRASFMPLHKMMKDAGEPLNVGNLSNDLLVAELGGGKLPVALPVAFSTPVLFYDKEAFRRAGLNPENPPATWQQMQAAGTKLIESGHGCAYTSSWLTWIHIDNMSALAGAPVSQNGQASFNTLPQVRHIARLASWYKAGYFQIFGNKNEADQHFARRECAMLTSNSWNQSWLREVPGLDLGVAPLPHDEDVYGGRRHTLTDGASLWVGNGFAKGDYKVAAKFVNFLLSPEIQIELARVGNFIPLTQTARSAMKSRLFRDEEHTQNVIAASLQGQGASEKIRVGSLGPVRHIIEDELSAVWAGRKPAKEALDNAVARTNSMLRINPALKKGLPF